MEFEEPASILFKVDNEYWSKNHFLNTQMGDKHLITMKKQGGLKLKTIIEIIASLLIIFFVYTSTSSFIQFQSLRNLLAFYTSNTTFVAWAMILAEAAIAMQIFFLRTRPIGFLGALLLIIIAGVIMFRYPYLPHDFGGIFNSISSNQKWILIALVAIFSLSGLLLSIYNKRRAHSIKNNEQAVVYT